MYEFCYNYIMPKYDKKEKLCYMDMDSFIIHIKIKDFDEYIADYVEKKIETSNYETILSKPLPTGKIKKVIGRMKDELGRNIKTEFIALRPKTYSYLMDDDSEVKKAKGTKKCVIKLMFKFLDNKDYLMNNKVILISQLRFKSERHNVYTEEVNKIELSNNDKRLQNYHRTTSYLHGASAGKVCKIEISSKKKHKIINFDNYTNENKTEHRLKLSYISDHPYRLLIVDGSGSGKTKALLKINNQSARCL